MYITQTITSGGTEADFLKSFISSLTALNIGITCDADIDALIAVDDSYCTFDMDFFGIETLRFKRNVKNKSTTTNYLISSVNSQRVSVIISFSSGYLARNDRSTRTWGYNLISDINNKVILFSVGDYNRLPSNGYPDLQASFLFSKDIDGYAYAVNYTANQRSNVYNVAIIGSDSSSYTKVNRLGYVYDITHPTRLEYINNKVYVVTGSSNRAFSTNSLMDCSIVTAGSIVTFDGKRYYALDAYTLMEVG